MMYYVVYDIMSLFRLCLRCNVRIYVIGCAVNLGFHLYHKPVSSLWRLTEGYNRYCWGLVATYSLMGLLLAQVMKFFDNIVKLFISGSSMYVSALLSYAIFGYTPTWSSSKSIRTQMMYRIYIRRSE